MGVTILAGDVRAMLAGLPAESVQCVVTSPPYFQLRDYGVAGQIGLEPTPAEFVATLVAVFEEVRRVMRPDGVCFVNIGDSYAGSGKGPTGSNGIGDQEQRQGFTGAPDNSKPNSGRLPKKTDEYKTPFRTGSGYVGHQQPSIAGIPAKNLLLIPQRFAIAMQDAGWYVRSQIAWCKTSAMPESVKDRPTSAWEPIWMFTRSARYFWDQDAVRQPGVEPDGRCRGPKLYVDGGYHRNGVGSETLGTVTGSANLRNYWLLGPEPSREEHYAAFPSEIPRRCILAATSEKGQCPACGSPWTRVADRVLVPTPKSKTGTATVSAKRGANRDPNDHRATWGDVHGSYAVTTTGWQPSCACDAGPPVPQLVLDPFLGSGTTALVADQLGRNAIGCELNPTYAEMARRRITNDCPMFTDVEVAV